jgi:sulfite oxidase
MNHAESLLNPVRRNLLVGSVFAGAFTLFKPLTAWSQVAAPAVARPLPAYAAFKDLGALIVHSANTIETRRSAMGGAAVTPVSQLYVRNNLGPPDASIVARPDEWQLQVEGVRRPRTLSVRELKAMDADETLAMVLQCSGNGRGFFPHKPSGTKWQVGASGCVIWKGVPVRAVVRALGGMSQGARFMTGLGGEVLPAGVDIGTRVERSVPLEAMQDALLAWELNGQPIPLAHGGPLRLIVPGYTGVNSVKYIKRLAFTAQENDAIIQKTRYRMSPLGEKSSRPGDPSVWGMGPKSFVTAPLPEDGPLRAGRVRVEGVAFGGLHAVAKVEVSTDGGASWKPAHWVGPDLGRYAWRRFELDADLTAGAHSITSRVTDVKGNAQPEHRLENRSGYLNASWRDHAVAVKVA